MRGQGDAHGHEDVVGAVAHDPLLGSVLDGAYWLVRVIGAGGMGTVYEAVHQRLNKRVAVKVMGREHAANDEALERFRREAEITSQLGHPHIVHVFDFGTAPNGAPYLVMEFLDGEDLDSRLRRATTLPVNAAGHVCKQVASALAATHARGVVHRDLKPANIVLLEIAGEPDFVKVVDFGISKVRAVATRITRSSLLMGTPGFMAPEQASGRVDDIDHRVDQWALACIVWEMLAGRGPFVGDDVAALLYQVCHVDPPSLRACAPHVDLAIEDVLRRALAKQPRDRFPTIAAFARAFEAAVEGKPLVGVARPVGADKKAEPIPTSTLGYGRAPKIAPVRGAVSSTDSELTTVFVPRVGARAHARIKLFAGGAALLVAGFLLARVSARVTDRAPPSSAAAAAVPIAVVPTPAQVDLPPPAPDPSLNGNARLTTVMATPTPRHAARVTGPTGKSFRDPWADDGTPASTRRKDHGIVDPWGDSERALKNKATARAVLEPGAANVDDGRP